MLSLRKPPPAPAAPADADAEMESAMQKAAELSDRRQALTERQLAETP